MTDEQRAAHDELEADLALYRTGALEDGDLTALGTKLVSKGIDATQLHSIRQAHARWGGAS